jgi:DNA-binding transcriptional LysR family regulator
VFPDIDSLALFVRAAELHSLTKAAEASHISVAAASRRITLLEHRFKAMLLERTSHGATLTPAGMSLLGHAKVLLRRMNQMEAAMGEHAGSRMSVVRLLVNTSALTGSFPDDLAIFARQNPEVRLVLQERWSADIVRMLAGDEADIGIVIEGIETTGLITCPYRVDRLSVVMPARLDIAEGPMAFEDVLQGDLVTIESSASMFALLNRQALLLGKTLRPRVQVRSLEAICRMVQAGFGLGLLPLHAATALAPGFGLAVRPLAEAWAQRSMLLCVRDEGANDASVAKLLGHLAAPTGAAAPGEAKDM